MTFTRKRVPDNQINNCYDLKSIKPKRIKRNSLPFLLPGWLNLNGSGSKCWNYSTIWWKCTCIDVCFLFYRTFPDVCSHLSAKFWTGKKEEKIIRRKTRKMTKNDLDHRLFLFIEQYIISCCLKHENIFITNNHWCSTWRKRWTQTVCSGVDQWMKYWRWIF